MELVKFKSLDSKAVLPERSRPTDVGLDLFSVEDWEIPPRGSVLCRTGVAIQLPENTAGLIWPRSGMLVRHNIETAAGVIDPSYHEEIVVRLHNHSYAAYSLLEGDRIAQLLIVPVFYLNPTWSEELSGSDRGSDVFGGSGR